MEWLRFTLGAGDVGGPPPVLLREETLLRHQAAGRGHSVEARDVVDAVTAGEAEGVVEVVPGVDAGVRHAVGGRAGGEASEVECPAVRSRGDQVRDAAGQSCGWSTPLDTTGHHYCIGLPSLL